MTYILFLIVYAILSVLIYVVLLPFFYRRYKKKTKLVSHIANWSLRKRIKQLMNYWLIPRIMFWWGLVGIVGSLLQIFVYVPDSKVAVLYKFGKIEKKVYFHGIHFKHLYEDYQIYPTGIGKKVIDNKVYTYYIDGRLIPVGISLGRIDGVKSLDRMIETVLTGKFKKEDAFHMGDFIKIISVEEEKKK